MPAHTDHPAIKALRDLFEQQRPSATTEQALNMPPDPPARDMQDPLYLAAPIVGGTWGAHRGRLPKAQVRAATLLRTHTSAMQIRYMKTFPPPIRIIVPGRVYRRDNLDLSHTPMFQQFE